ncbi:MAG: hypothetical protein WB614_22145, partial [Pseudolabrys sp.]
HKTKRMMDLRVHRAAPGYSRQSRYLFWLHFELDQGPTMPIRFVGPCSAAFLQAHILAKKLLYLILDDDCYAGSFKLALWQYGS